MDTAEYTEDLDNPVSKSGWYEVGKSAQPAFFKHQSGDVFYITDRHEGRLRANGEQYSAVYLDRETGEQEIVHFDSADEIGEIGKLDDIPVEALVHQELT